MKAWVCLVWIILLAPVGGLAAQEGGGGLSVALEGRLLHQADEFVSPLRYSGAAWGPAIRYGFPSDAERRSLYLSFGFPTLTSSQSGGGAHKQEGYRANLSAEVYRRMAEVRGGDIAFFLGGELRGDFAFYDHWYTSVDRESWANFFGLLHGGGGWWIRVPFGGELWQAVSFPLAGVVVRPDYQGMTETPGVRWEGIGGVAGWHHLIQLSFPLGGWGRWSLSYDFLAQEYSEPRPLAMTRQAFSLRATLWRGR